MPGVNPANANMWLQILQAAPGLIAVATGAWLALGEPGRLHGQQAAAIPWFEDVTSVVGLDFTQHDETVRTRGVRAAYASMQGELFDTKP